jgi:hypothetical protein
MNAEAPQPPGGQRPRRIPGRLATLCAVAGVLIGTAAAISKAAGAISVQQTIALALPAALLIVGAVIAAIPPDAATALRHGVQAGLRLGSLLSRMRSMFRRRGDNT